MMLSGLSGGRFAPSGHSAYQMLHHPCHRPQSPTDATGTLENILNPPTDSTNVLPGRRNVRQQNTITQSKAPPRTKSRTTLSMVIADEEYLAQRKSDIARFGSTWIRPPGISKTKQAMDDEEAEMKEQELAMQREAALAEERAAQERADREAGRTGVGLDAAMDDEVAQEDMDPEGERDLDAEVPEAEPMESEEDYEEEEDDEPSAIEADESLPAMDGERDLDEDVPEAGSYEHTDTELESSDFEDSRMSAPLRPFTLPPPGAVEGQSSGAAPGAGLPGTPASLGLDSSMLLSSPGAARGDRRGQNHREL